MTTQPCNITKLQAEIIWRALWIEIDDIQRELDERILTESAAYTRHLETIAMLRQINVRFHILQDSTFEEMVNEARLREQKFAYQSLPLPRCRTRMEREKCKSSMPEPK